MADSTTSTVAASATTTKMMDANEAAASVGYRLSDVIAIYPITPSSPMGESSDEWSVAGKLNLWGQVPTVAEMQSEGGAAGAVHGALTAGAMTTTFTASQGLLLMVPNLYKIAGELTPCVIHVAARALATHALSIFGDHSDVMACRQTGMAMLCANSVQEAHDLAAIAHAATLHARVPIMHFFDGFRTSHEVGKVSLLDDDQLRQLIPQDLVDAHRTRGLSPDHPSLRGTAQNPDVFFQAHEAGNLFYDQMPGTVQQVMDEFAALTGRGYRLFEYVGAPDAERVVIMMGSGAEVAHETVDYLTDRGEKVGLLKVRLYRPWSAQALLEALPATVQRVAVLDRTKEPGATGEPLYLDIVTSLAQSWAGTYDAPRPRVVGGRYGLGSKEFNPTMVAAVFEHLTRKRPANGFTVGINDDVTNRSLPLGEPIDAEPAGVTSCVFFGLGSDGTVGANKNSIKIIGDEPGRYAQGYFVYDSKKSGAMTISHLRFGPQPIRSSYLIDQADFVACHQFNFLGKYDVMTYAKPGATVLLNAPHPPDQVWANLPRGVQQDMLDKRVKLYVIDANTVARESGMGGRINTVMQTCFFAISGVLPRDEAIDRIKQAIRKTYGRKGEEIVQRNFEAVDASLDNMHQTACGAVNGLHVVALPLADDTPDFMRDVQAPMLLGEGDRLPVSVMPKDGVWPVNTARYEKRRIADEVPVWDPEVCVQCNRCALVCPHATIRVKVYEGDKLRDAPETFQHMTYKAKEFRGLSYTVQVAPEDCTGCNLCVEACPAKNKAEPRLKAINMTPLGDVLDEEKQNFDYFQSLPYPDRDGVKRVDAKGSQFFEPLFEYSGACAGCGETPYVKLLTQLFGDRMLVANATGCSSIYSGNLPTTPYCTNQDGRGPAWSNSLFEDNAEFGFGMRLASEQHHAQARALLQELAETVGRGLARTILDEPRDLQDAGQLTQLRGQIEQLKHTLRSLNGSSTPASRKLLQLADHLVPRSVWLLGGDGWAYDIGYGGLDHVIAQQRDVNILVLDTEVYSNTGGQASKATPLGAAAKFAMAGKDVFKKDLGLMAMQYGHAYVASVAMGADANQTVQALREAASYPGPSLVIAYSHCIAHGYDLRYGMQQQQRAVASGIWPLYRYDPRKLALGEPPLTLDAKPPSLPVSEYMSNETRFRMVQKMHPERFHELSRRAQELTRLRVATYRHMAELNLSASDDTDG